MGQVEVFARTPDGREHRWFVADEATALKALSPPELLATAVGHLHHLIELMTDMGQHTHHNHPGCHACETEHQIREMQLRILRRTMKSLDEEEEGDRWRTEGG